MRLRLPRHYTVLITRTGKTPVELNFRPLPCLLAALAIASLPMGWIASLLYQNAQLNQRNESLANTANEVLSELETLDTEVETLRERAGLPSHSSAPRGSATSRSQGGVAQKVEAERLFAIAQARMPQLANQLQGQVRPALEDTLAQEAAREAAFPSASPLQANLAVSSEFGLRPNPFGGKGYELHDGIDFRGPIGTPIYATANGVVVTARYSGGYGKHVRIDHGYGYETLYAHLNAVNVSVGDTVRRGDLIGELGNTGRSSGPHLHYGIYRKGQAVNPRYYLQLRDE